MPGKSNYLENKVLNDNLPNGTTYLALLTSATVPDFETGTSGTEVTGGAYARQAIPFATPATTGSKSNSGDITFPVATASWGLVRYFEIRDASTGGNLLYGGQFTSDKQIDADDQLKITTGSLTITED
jgi:hypothetical protein